MKQQRKPKGKKIKEQQLPEIKDVKLMNLLPYSSLCIPAGMHSRAQAYIIFFSWPRACSS